MSIEKKVIVSTGLKGGCGKTFGASTLLSYLREQGHKVAAYDCDAINPQLFRFHSQKGADGNILPVQAPSEGASILDMSNYTETDKFINNFENANGVALLLDLPAGRDGQITTFDESYALSEVLSALDYQLVILFSMGDSQDSVSLLFDTIKRYGKSAKIAVLLPGVFSHAVYEEAEPVREALRDVGGIEIRIPELEAGLKADLDLASIPYHDARESDALTFAKKLRLKVWLQKLDAELVNLEKFISQ